MLLEISTNSTVSRPVNKTSSFRGFLWEIKSKIFYLASRKKKNLDYSLMVTPKLLLGKVKVILNGLR